jgi:hypothetical protein
MYIECFLFVFLFLFSLFLVAMKPVFLGNRLGSVAPSEPVAPPSFGPRLRVSQVIYYLPVC